MANLNDRLEKAEETLSELENSSLRWSILRKKNEKWTQPQSPVEHKKKSQHMNNRNLRRSGEKGRDRKNIWRNNGWKPLKFDEKQSVPSISLMNSK